mgnify:CR=1 FL=1
MAEPTIHDRVVQAVLRDAELMDALLALKQTLLEAKQAEDAIRKNTQLSDEVAALRQARDATIAEAQRTYDAAVAKAQIPLAAAMSVHNAALSAAQGPLALAKETATAQHDAEVARLAHVNELALAEGRAAVHHAEQEIAAKNTTIDQHRRNIQERLGINIANLMR